MTLNHSSRLDKSAFFLLPIIALACYIAFIPKINYAYPVHIDEWVHIAHTESLLRAADINYPDPFSGEIVTGLVTTLESGFHVLFGVFSSLSGLSLLDISRYFPSIIFAVTVLSVYILARREGFGWEAAFMTCLVPTTVGIMGPAFFIPIGLSLPFIPLSLLLVFNYRTVWSYLLLFVFLCFLIITHATSAVCLVLIMVPCVLIYLKKEPRHGIILLLMGVVPFLITLPWTFNLIKGTAESLFVAKPLPVAHDLPMILKLYGYVPFELGLLGTFWLAVKGGVKNYNLVLSLLVMVMILAAFFTLHYGVDLIYLRGILFTLLLYGIVAGAGLMAVKNLALPLRLRVPAPLRRVGYAFSLILVIVILVIAIPNRNHALYYHMIDNEDYNTFVWIKQNVTDNYPKAILDPWKATPFTAITGKYVYARIHMGPDAVTMSADTFLADNCTDTDFLRKNGISFVYTRQECTNSDLVQVSKWVYLLRN